MWLILDECFILDEMEPGFLAGLMQPSHLHLTNSTSKFSQRWKTSDEVAERRNSFLCCEVPTDKLSSLLQPLGCHAAMPWVDTAKMAAFRSIW
jgi:hypothetical protein